MTKTLISALIVAAVVGLGWLLFDYWNKIENEKFEAQKEANSKVVVPERLPGLPWELEGSLKSAQAQGPEAFGQWLKHNARSMHDPRKAWIELDYCVMLARKDPQEARRVFASVKSRTPANSPVAPRIRDLARTFE